MMGDTYKDIMGLAKRRWMLERARQILAIESEMSVEQLKDPENKYWVMYQGQRYLELNELHYLKKDDGTIVLNTDKPSHHIILSTAATLHATSLDLSNINSNKSTPFTNVQHQQQIQNKGGNLGNSGGIVYTNRGGLGLTSPGAYTGSDLNPPQLGDLQDTWG